ncbi:MAG: sigma-70 family RNA polymerase sigma factor [Microgenomates group bacterium]
MNKLIGEVMGGKKGAATRFYREFAPCVRRYLNTKLPECEVEEILQDTFVSAFDSLALYRGEASVSTWLISIARHEVADFYRKKYVREVVEKTSPLFENLVSEINSPEFVMKKNRIEKRFFASYRSLSKQYQDILSYRYELSMSVKEIAERMDLPFKATESLLYRARLAFREDYESRE